MRKVSGYEDYCVSEGGHIKSFKRNRELFLTPYIDRYGYHVVNLCAGKKRKAQKVHRIVAQAFIPNPDKKPQVNHKDGDKLNNSVENLEWCSASDNKQHSYSVLGVGRIKKVRCVETGVVYESGRSSGRILGIRREGISDVLRGKQKTAGGYHWELAVWTN